MAFTQASAFELLLVLATVVSALLALRARVVSAAAGFALLGAAALAGALEYSGATSITAVHDQLSIGASWMAVPLICACNRAGRCIALAALAGWLIQPDSAVLYAVAVAALAYRLYTARRARWPILAALAGGALLFAIAGLAIGSTGTLLGVPRRDLYHACLSLATLLLAAPFWASPLPAMQTAR